MKSLKIISKTEAGENALKTHVEETLKAKWIVRQALKKTGFNQELSIKKPVTLHVWASPNSMFSMSKIKHVKDEIDEAMNKMGAVADIDYYYEEPISEKVE